MSKTLEKWFMVLEEANIPNEHKEKVAEFMESFEKEEKSVPEYVSPSLMDINLSVLSEISDLSKISFVDSMENIEQNVINVDLSKADLKKLKEYGIDILKNKQFFAGMISTEINLLITKGAKIEMYRPCESITIIAESVQQNKKPMAPKVILKSIFNIIK